MANQSIRAAFERLWQHVTVALGSKADKSEIPKAFSNIKVGSTTIAADTTTDTLELVAGSNITLTPNATNDKITITATGSGTSSTDTNYYHTPSATSGIKIATGTGVNDMYVPTGTSATTVAVGNHTHSDYATTTYVNETLGEIESVLAAL